MEAYYAVMIKDVRHERSLLLFLSLTEPDIIKQTKFTDHETYIMKKLALGKLQTTNTKRGSSYCFTRT